MVVGSHEKIEKIVTKNWMAGTKHFEVQLYENVSKHLFESRKFFHTVCRCEKKIIISCKKKNLLKSIIFYNLVCFNGF